MGRKRTQKVAEFVDRLVSTGVEHLVGDGKIEEGMARRLMTDVATSICKQYSRTILYVPANLEPSRCVRDAQMLAAYAEDGPDGVRKFTSERVAQLAEQFNLGVAQTYAILQHKPDRPAAQAQPAGAFA